MKDLTRELVERGFCILPSVFGAADIAEFRAATEANLGSMGRTRDAAHSFHLAGFHRFPSLAALHGRIVSDGRINDFLADYYAGNRFYAIGLSDITVNRSQQWHTDLLRGRYADFLKDGLAWGPPGAGCIKALVYLQDGASLGIVPGSHRVETPLDDLLLDRLAQSKDVVKVAVKAGEVVMMDIRALHRGATDAEMSRPELAERPKILLSTVFGAIGSAFTQAMQIGNAHRMADWDGRFLGSPPP